MTPNVVPITAARNDLGESLHWDAVGGVLHWIDAWPAIVHTYDPRSGEIRQTDHAAALGGRPIGSIACRTAGGMIAGVRGGFHRLDPATGAARLVAAVEADRPATNRLNDGKCDRAGRFWCASVNTDHRTPSGALWRLDAQGDAVMMQDGLIAGNGIAWSPDDRTMYLADTFAGTVWRYDFDLASGTLTNRRLFLATGAGGGTAGDSAGGTTGGKLDGAVDGATVDADGCYWAALFRGGAVARFDPDDGRLIRRIDLPVSDPTTCAFGGPDLDILYVTSASRFLDDGQRRAQPLAGHVFAIEGLGVRGLAEPRYAG